MTEDWLLDRRMLWMKIILILFVGFLITVFWRIQVLQGDRYLRLSQNNRIRRVRIPSPRGKILDRNGIVMVDNRPSFDVVLEYESLKNRNPAVNFLSRILDMTPQEIEKVIKSYRGPSYLSIPIKKDVDMATLTRVEEAKDQMPSISVEVNPIRNYVLGERASALLGYVGSINSTEVQKLKERGYNALDVIGKSGVEAACEPFLRGESGGMQIEVDHRGYREDILSIKKPIPGRNLYLTIDMKIQEALEAALAGRIGAGIVMNPKNGEILAMASQPSFDLNLFVKPELRPLAVLLFKDPQRPLVNRALQGLYGPGSVFKLVMACAGLDCGVINDATSFICHGSYQVGGSVFKCWKEIGHGTVALRDAIKYSCNVFFYNLGQILGPIRIADYSRRFGLGQSTGLDVGNDRAGFIPTPQWKREKLKDGWYGGDTANFSIGQGYVTVTPIQIAVMVSAIANDGKLISPYLVKRVVLPEGRTLIEIGPKVRGMVNISEGVLSKVQNAMRAVVNDPDGTGKLARIETAEVCGKTGTVQVAKGDQIQKMGWFVAYAPYKDPQIVLVLIVEGVETGGRTVAPLAKLVLEKIFPKTEIAEIRN